MTAADACRKARADPSSRPGSGNFGQASHGARLHRRVALRRQPIAAVSASAPRWSGLSAACARPASPHFEALGRAVHPDNDVVGGQQRVIIDERD